MSHSLDLVLLLLISPLTFHTTAKHDVCFFVEDHFRDDHHLCPHQSCMEKKFGVFASELDLKRHFAAEHGGEMSRAQRREAFSVPVQLQYRGREDTDAQQAADAAAALALHERATVVIGGGQGLTAGRMGQRGGAPAMHHSRSEPRDLSSAVQVGAIMRESLIHSCLIWRLCRC